VTGVRKVHLSVPEEQLDALKRVSPYFLAGYAASFINGAEIPIDGGATARQAEKR
jgi:hypothetical protein